MFRRLPSLPGPRLALYCDYEGHYAGPAAAACSEAGLDRLLYLLADCGVRITFNVVADLCRTHPDRVRRIADAGHELACHGWRHERPRDLPDAELDSMLANATACFAELGFGVDGFRSPQSAWSLALLRRLPFHGFRWNAERDRATGPYRIRRGLIRVPIATDDWGLVRGLLSVGDLVELWLRLADAPMDGRRFVALGVHEWTLGLHEELAGGLEEFLKAICRRPGATISPLGAAVMGQSAAQSVSSNDSSRSVERPE